MELRGQDKKIGMPSSLGYNSPIRESSSKVSSASVISTGEGRRRDGTFNGILNPSQTLDHHHHRHYYNQPQGQQGGNPDPDPDPDPVPVAIAVGGATGAPIAGGSNSRTPTTTTNAVTVRYRECLKNHAASTGGHIVDGCGEFMPSGEEGTPEAIKCAACDCHRNFHRKEIDGEPQSSAANYYYCYDPYNKNTGTGCRIPPPQPPPPPLQQHHKFHYGLPMSPSLGSIPPMMMAFGGGGGGGGGGATESSSEDLNAFQSNAGASQPPPFAGSKKRFRTKFTQEQKDRMLEFAEKVGWRIQKQDEPVVQQFCAEVGVKRQVLKVWMHNNKNSMKKNQL